TAWRARRRAARSRLAGEHRSGKSLFHDAVMTTRPMRIAAAIGLLLAVAVPIGRAQQTAPQRAAGTVKAGVTAVLVDVVVRDKRGQPVRDLQQSDFQVLEDGVPQTIGSFTRMFDG